MKVLYNLCLAVLMVGLLTACELDNLEGPDSGLTGSIIDSETNRLVPQDILEGTQIEIWEHGWDPVTPQRLEIKNDGTYADLRLFSNTYDVIPVNTNFHNNATVTIDTIQVEINGLTELDFNVLPYVRIVDLNISKVGNKAIASFRLEQPLDSVYLNADDVDKTAVVIKEVGLYAHFDPHVGVNMNLAKNTTSINDVIRTGENDEYQLEFDPAKDSDFLAGGKVFLRVGALSTMPAARANYGSTIEIDF
ncbi:DUF3823 domain-containing protein [Reichenbachiella ulvae]|uniref:DUF3823 domain-containing protein n=1 Tax=Reichenbachiella ulvae TaxID=2980104 RepID=A0ABT3CP60_9BACT|nr:DUF3823 domain-containing protein [Reichenbachiella ulvae]MCV9385254.1 DUF3823 domain-containing protein [Reichenbachiella ulvae]